MLQPVYTFAKIAEIIQSKNQVIENETLITELVTDSRLVRLAEHALFFALVSHRDGHQFIKDALAKGIKHFVISKPEYQQHYPETHFIVVDDVLRALQRLATWHRNQFTLKTIGITGSNGKTIVKEWLYQLLANDFNIIRSPKSYNSQIGVALSLWQIEATHNLGIFEAGISATNEMDKLAEMIKPNIGILTNIGEAHAEGFASKTEKLTEKLKLFKHAKQLIFSPDYVDKTQKDSFSTLKHFTWSTKQSADLQVFKIIGEGFNTKLFAYFKGEEINCNLPFNDKASIENGIICWATLLSMNYTPAEVALRLNKLSHVSMRLALKNGINQCSIIDDSYSADQSSLTIALDFLSQQNQHTKKTVILSDLFETGKSDLTLYTEIANLLSQKKVSRLIGIGEKMSHFAHLFSCDTQFFTDTDSFVKAFDTLQFNHETILVKGARRFDFGRISKLLTQKIHDTVLEIDLNAMVSNLQFYRAKLKPGVKIMAMVKAFSYGSGSFEIANLLQFHKVDYLAVAYADEGIALRKAGITLPIMVMSPQESAFEAIISHQLEPEIYSLEILSAFIAALPADGNTYAIHLKMDSGMHRLGFDKADINLLIEKLKLTERIKVNSIFSHLVASSEAKHDDFTKKQIADFEHFASLFTQFLGYKPLLHMANTAGISRWPQAQFDMVRLGIGLYGFDAALTNQSSLKTTMVLNYRNASKNTSARRNGRL